ncbi:MAG: DUF89 family protein [Chloroflexi bacterium]|nr:DUF89 family protein [Chloroflexota bacterium]
MKTHLDCYACLLRQALSVARKAGCDEETQLAVMKSVLQGLQEVRTDLPPPFTTTQIHRMIREKLPGRDPYLALKERSTQKALALYPWLKELVEGAGDPLEMAMRLAIAGNIIDFGPADDYDLVSSVERAISEPLAVNDVEALREAIENTDQVLYLADNAGETVFDRVLIEQIPVPVYYAVKNSPVLNDATEEDAVAAGIEQYARIVSTGSDTVGTILECCSEEFKRLYDQAEVIIAKGMGNYETLSTGGSRLFFLLQAKCEPVARDMQVPVRSLIVRRG